MCLIFRCFLLVGGASNGHCKDHVSNQHAQALLLACRCHSADPATYPAFWYKALVSVIPV